MTTSTLDDLRVPMERGPGGPGDLPPRRRCAWCSTVRPDTDYPLDRDGVLGRFRACSSCVTDGPPAPRLPTIVRFSHRFRTSFVDVLDRDED